MAIPNDPGKIGRPQMSARQVVRSKSAPRRRLSDMLAVDDETPLRIRELAAMTGFTKQKIAADIKAGYLDAAKVPCGTQSVFLVPFPEARRWLHDLKLLPTKSA